MAKRVIKKTRLKAANKLQNELPNWIWVRTADGNYSGTFEGVRKNLHGPYIQLFTNRLIRVYLFNISEIKTANETIQVVAYFG